MATTENGTYYPDDYTKKADVPGDMKKMAESIDANKVQKIEGKGLSTNDFTNEYKQKLDGLENYDDTDIKKDISDIKEEQDELISKLKSALINVETEEAKSLHIEDASTVPAQLKVMGNHEQETSTQGKNYFTGNKIASGTAFGVTYSFDNSILKANGTSTVSGSIVLDADTGVKLPAGTYTYTVKKVAGDYTRQNGQDFALYLKNDSDWITGDYATSGITGSNLQNNSGIYSRQITITEETEIYFRFFVSSANIVFNNLELEIQIESGSEYTEFEQFVPNMPSPNYPSEVKCLGSNKNLYPGWEQGTINSETGNNAYDPKYIRSVDFIPVFPKVNYTLRAHNVENITMLNTAARMYDINKQYLGSQHVGHIKNAGQTFALTNTDVRYIKLVHLNSDNIPDTAKADIKLEEGTEETAYSPYRTR